VATGRTRLLIDIGLSCRELRRRLASIGEDFDRLDAILISHEHSDHVSGLLPAVRAQTALKRRVPVHMTRLTAAMFDWQNLDPAVEIFPAGSSFNIGDIEIASFTVPHDAVDPVGFTCRAGGVKAGFATDLGYIPESVKYHLRGCQVLVLESNHDIEMLKVGPYPWAVKQRVMSRKGHLSNDTASEFIRDHIDTETSTIVLGHLSQHNNHPELVRMSAEEALNGRAVFTQLVVAEPGQPTGPFVY
jgi:phosphoribosyl 1,2-cyclic phosphodiesterase